MNEKLYEKVFQFVLKNPGLRAKEIAKQIGQTKTEVNQVLHSKEHKAEFIQNENFEWFVSPGITIPIKPIKGIYFLTDIDCLPEITLYDGSVDFANKLQTVSTAMLCMKSVDYVYIELKRHMDTGDFYCDVHNWQGYQKEYDGFVSHVAYYDSEEGIRKRNFTDHLSDYSTLRLLGYHVGENISESSRRRILMNCVYFGLIQMDKITSHIKYLIKYGKKTPKAKMAWENDLKFIKEYNENINLPAWHLLKKRKYKWRNNSDQLKKDFLKQMGKEL